MLVAVVLSVAAVLAALVVPAAAAVPDHPHGPDVDVVCEDLHETPTRVPLCTHGGDRVATFGGHAEVQEAPAAATPTDLAALCTGDGVSGRRIEVLYGVPQDRTNRYATMLPTIRNVLAQIDGNLAEAGTGVEQHYRWYCGNGSDVTVRNVTLLPVGGDSSFTWTDYLNSVQNQIALGLGGTNFTAADRIYVTFVDQITDVYPYGGQGSVFGDDSPDPATNWNNNATQYSMSAYFDAEVAAHEIGHNLGAVQNSAPHSSGGYHCFDELDMMCYSDGGPYFTGGGALTYPCVTFTQDYVVDCGKDDYYYPGTPPSGNYLADHWNIADSGFLTPLGPAADITPPAVTSRAPSTNATGEGVGSVVAAGFGEAVQGVDASTFQLRKAGGSPLTATVSYDGGTDVATLDPDADLAPDTRYTVTLTGGAGAIRDLADNPLPTTSWSFTTGPAPGVTSVAPAVNATVAPITGNVAAAFGEPVQGVSTATFVLRRTGGSLVSARVTYDAARRVAILDPGPTLLPDTRWTATLTGGTSGIRDAAGNPLPSTSWTFTTGPAPTLASRSPAHGAVNVGRTANVAAAFSEPVQGVSTASFLVRNARTGAVVPAVVSRSASNPRAWVLNPSVTLPAGTPFNVTVIGGPTAIRDLAGNPLTTSTWRFTTGSR
jgi:hypothetical protein